MDLDRTDLEIVRHLQADGRMTFETIAQRVGLSRPATRTRAQRLLTSGAVRIVAIVHPAVKGLTAIAHASIRVDGPARPVAQSIAELAEAPFVTLTVGGHAVVAEVRAPDFGALATSIERLRSMPGVRGVDTLVYTRVLKDSTALSEPRGDLQMDEIDHRILAELQADGRIAFADLGERVGLSPGAARVRALRLLEAGVARVVALVRPDVLGMGQLCGFALTVEGDAAPLVEQLSSWERVSYLAACMGRADLVGTVAGESLPDVITLLERVRAMKGVRELTSWVHAELVKERY
ncbi:Lrp/AsnC family transcriptional regulator [Nonomuraea africana]|uniref:DNA-binding Lrp family transcriptional regulator n=1 Tax=Nonomuraea africana TaxID=46171 RepID=A0ABR9KII8_9ACTN|nr:Lrp/AsnC family transcriptional regulator [Nonomuraea africana]MBE1561834.1 DNA-binding Lrp family transcriptional regulator [Nonomuraea africana]